MPTIVQIADLKDRALDWAVLMAEGMLFMRNERGDLLYKGPNGAHWAYFEDESASRDWDIGGHLLQQNGISVMRQGDKWYAFLDLPTANCLTDIHEGIVGDTALQAVCRAYVFLKIGPSVEVPELL